MSDPTLPATPDPAAAPDFPAAPDPPAARDRPAAPDPWSGLRRFTPARIALGAVGASLPTSELLAFSLAHARARDAVHLAFESEALAASFEAAGFPILYARSQATNRLEYLSRPDLGRRLDPASVPALTLHGPAPANRLTVVVADGLSSLAAARHALPLLLALKPHLSSWQLDSVVLATEARVALSDPIGQLREAEAVLILLGERPGLSSVDSLGAYLTYAPRPGRTDAERNCVSNIRIGGLPYENRRRSPLSASRSVPARRQGRHLRQRPQRHRSKRPRTAVTSALSIPIQPPNRPAGGCSSGIHIPFARDSSHPERIGGNGEIRQGESVRHRAPGQQLSRSVPRMDETL